MLKYEPVIQKKDSPIRWNCECEQTVVLEPNPVAAREIDNAISWGFRMTGISLMAEPQVQI